MENMTVGRLAAIVNGTLLAGDPQRTVSHISIDSRAIGADTLFVPLIGERVDAHRFLPEAAETAACVLCGKEIAPRGTAAWIRTGNTAEALGKIGSACREQMKNLKVAAVTGSVGKTTTREMTATVLSSAFRTFRTAKNYNSDIGVPIMLSELSEADEAAVLELGMSDFGEMEKIARMAKPDLAVITNIGVAHIAQLGTRENILREKLSVTRGMKPGSLLILNGDDGLLRGAGGIENFRTVYFGLGPRNDYRAEEIVFTEGETSFLAVTPDGTVPVRLPVSGTHMVMNALAAVAAARAFGISPERAASALAGFRPFSGRQQIYRVGNFRVIDDTYNASPDSMRAALGVLASLPCSGRRTAVLADMLELGRDEERYHREIGEFAAGLPLDELICIGSLAEKIAQAAEETSPSLSVRRFSDNRQAAEYLLGSLSGEDLVLFKGSNRTRLGEIIAILKEERS